jgi:hypothetical protein
MREDLLEQVEVTLEEGELLVALLLEVAASPAIGEDERAALRYRKALCPREVVLHLALQKSQFFPVRSVGVVAASAEAYDDVFLDEQKQVEDLLLHGEILPSQR